jgi:hypothetical protein
VASSSTATGTQSTTTVSSGNINVASNQGSQGSTETPTQTSNDVAMRVVHDRSDAAAGACPASFRRIETADRSRKCEPIEEPADARTAPRGPSKKESRLRLDKKPAAVRPAPLPSLAVLPPVVSGPVLASWSQVFGDSEYRRNALDQGAPGPYNRSVTTWGILVGTDVAVDGLTSRDDGVLFGLLAGYSESTTKISGSTSNPISSVMKTTGGSVGLYGTFHNQGFSTDGLVKIDIFNLNDTSSFGFPATSTISGSTPMTNFTVAQNVNYRFSLERFWIEPTAGASVTLTDFGGDAAALGFAHGDVVRVQGGLRYGTLFDLGNNIRLVPILTTLVYNDVSIKGFVAQDTTTGVAPFASTADQGKFRGQGVLALNFDFGGGISSFVQGELRGGEDYFGGGGRAGIRVAW